MADDSQPEPPADHDPAPPSVSVPEPDTGYTPAGVPTLEGVRDKIESRYGTALGATELAGDTPEGRRASNSYEIRQKAAAEKLEEIRASMDEAENQDG
jgi:phage shock protein A